MPRKEAAPVAVASYPAAIEQNPYQRLLYGALRAHGIELAPPLRLRVRELLRARGRVGILHFHWPQACYRHDGALVPALAKLLLFVARLRIARALGYRIVWTIHQVVPHESPRPRLDRFAARALGRAAHTLLAHDATTADTARDVLRRPAQAVAIVPHGSYVGVYPPGRPRAEARARLGLGPDTFAFLAFGHVRAYKDLDLLLAAFSRADLADAALVVAGLPMDAAAAEAVTRAAERDPRIRPLLRFVGDDEVAELFGACDAAVVSRRDGGTSGALVLAASLGLPVVATDAPVYRELLGDGEAGWLFAPDEASLAATLATAASDPDAARRKGAAAAARARSLRWDEIATRTAELVVGHGRVDVLLVCSSGGHLLQLLALRAAWGGFSRLWVTNEGRDASSLLREERAFFVNGPPRARHPRSALRNLVDAVRVVRRARPRVVLTTGADVAVPFAWVARAFGARIVYVESFTRIDEPSLACRLIAPAADRVYVQWPELVDAVPGARYAGAVVSTR